MYRQVKFAFGIANFDKSLTPTELREGGWRKKKKLKKFLRKIEVENWQKEKQVKNLVA